ncbi:MAG: hypothetical protein J6S69_09270, partial [Proteobacteria bacterium]|nr:hypothetical protein [Pseudomonadota bacterium]
MKKLFVFLIAVVMAGCQLDAIQKTGDYCPPKGLEGSISYIENAETCNAENSTNCTIYGNSHHFETHFANGICPEEYPRCISETTDDGVVYHCEKDAKVVCGGKDVLDCRNHDTPESESDTSQCIVKLQDDTCGANNCEEENYGGINCTAIGKHCQKTGDDQYACVCDEGELSCADSCIDPSKDETCGANQCDAENYGGVDCAVNNGRCKLKEDKYVCVCNNDALSCGNKCIDPRDEETCGANDCDAENYGGMDCTQIEDMRCVAGDDEIYSCQCAPGFILCDGKCIKPSYDDNYCGAVGACSSTDPESPDFMGYDCKANGGLCRDGQCTCFAGSWCTVEGEEQPRCVDPSANETCNATLNETTGVCTITPCQDNESCTARSSTEYYCNIADCLNEDELLCPEPQNGNVCYSKYDIDHCGSCDAKCKILNTSSYQAVGCEDNNGIPGCTFECIEGLTNCGTAFEPVCVEIDINVEHCGTCGQACKPGQYCENGQCMNTDCSETECTTKNSDGDQICVNTNTQCGPNCTPCQNIHANSYCQDGTCFISQCNAGEHPIFNDTGHITACHKNSKTACAPTNRTTSDPIVDCEASKDANVSTVECSDDGYCAIVSCVNGYHMSSDKTSCVKNSNSACGSPTSSTTIKCEIPNAASQACQDDGTCKVTNCNSGYHLSSDGRSCVANTNKLCGATNSSATKNCEEISNKSTVSCENGTCKVTACASGYHPNSGYTACLTNSSTECGTTTSSTVK